jgi:diguanylate cyclase (GGDEF)-like protein
MVDMHSARGTAASLLALLYALSGCLSLVGAAWPMHRTTPVALLWTLGAVGIGGSAILWGLARRLPASAIHAGVLLASGLIALLAWRTASPVGIVGLGPALVALALFSAHFFPLAQARWHVTVLVVAASAGAWAAAPSGFLVQWAVLVVSVAAIAEVQGRFIRHLRTAAATDPLTGVANRRAWESEAQRNLARASRTGEPVSFAILDLDDFKEVNDQAGHSAGDALLRELTARWSHRLRGADLLGRYGGDEFVLCLPGTDEDGARELLEQLEESHEFAWSAGTAVARAGDTLDSVLARADADLYQQKRAGRA